MNPSPQRALPSVDAVLQRLGPQDLPRAWVVREIREALAGFRAQTEMPAPDSILAQIRDRIHQRRRTRLQSVINGTGILAHTNLGRAPLSSTAVETLREIGEGYSNLELDLSSGRRGSRGGYTELGLSLLCGCEAAAVVNNGAAALVLILQTFVTTTRPEVVLSRGELVQIGGGFRIPEILECAGATLREVGTTNRTTLDDYAAALGPATALVLKVHRSNFYMEGFVDSPTTRDLAALARRHDIPFVEDLGSGALVDLEDIAPSLHHEPTPAETLAQGADLVCFSGDKLLGGPQSGVIAGRAPLVQATRAHPMFRALRCDKLVLGALQATVEQYLAPAARPHSLPMLALMEVPLEQLRERAAPLIAALALRGIPADLVESQAQVGGGVCPRSSIPSIALRLRPYATSVEAFAARLRAGTPPVIAILQNGACLVDLRTVFPRQDDALRDALLAAFTPDADSLPAAADAP